jgi:two-component system sensor histidine kinase YesM
MGFFFRFIKNIRSVIVCASLNTEEVVMLQPMSFQHRLMLVIIITVLLPSVLINVLTFTIIKYQMQKDASIWLTEIVDNSGTAMQNYIQLVNGLTKNPEYDITLMNIFDEHRSNKEQIYGYTFEELAQINGWLSMLAEMDKNMVSVKFVDEMGNRFQLGNNPIEEQRDWIEQTKKLNGGSFVWPPIKTVDGITVFSVSRTVINPKTFHSIATIQLNFQFDFLKTDNEIFSHSGDFLILNEENTVIFDLHDKFLGKVVSWDDHEQFQAVFNSEITGWKLVGVIPKTVLYNKIDQVQKWVLIINLIFIALTLALVYWFSYQLTQPLRRLSSIMLSSSKRNFNIPTIKFKRNDEIGLISTSFNQMIRRIHDLIGEVTETEQKRKRAEIQALQSQINPHFLYNTLNVITMQAELDENYKISDMSSLLGKLLRYSIGRLEEWVEVGQESEYIWTYIRVMQYRFPFIKFDIKLDENVRSWLVLSLILQPIVENAVIHGIVPKTGDGLISIRLIEKKMEVGESRLVIQIEDSGVGMSKEAVDELNKYLIGSQKMMVSRKYGIGIKNVYDRITLSYDRDFTFIMQSEEGIGTSFYIELPRRF